MIGLANHTILVTRDGTERPIADSGAPIFGTTGEVTGVVLVFRDQTAERQAQAALMRERQTLQAVFDGIDDVTYVADPKTYELLHVNETFTKTWGESVIGQKCYRVLQGRDAPCPFCTNDKIFGEYLGKSYIWEFQNEVTGDWFRCSDKAIRWVDGRSVRFELASNITENKMIEKALAQSEENFQLLFETMPIGWAEHKMIFDEGGAPSDYVFLRVNAAFEKFTGLERTNIINRRVTEIIPGIRDADPDLVSIYGEVTSTGKEQNLEIYFPPFDRWYHITAFRSRPEHFVAMLEDITTQKKTQKRIQEEEQKVSAFLENTEDLVTVVDNKGRFIYVNQAVKKIFGLTPDEMIGKIAFDFIHPDDRDSTQEAFNHWLGSKVKGVSYENQQVSTDGSIRHMLWTILIKYNDQGEAESFWSIARDLTERIENENLLKIKTR